MSKDQPNIATILAELRTQVKERQARFAVDDPNDPHALNLAELKKSVEAVNDTWFVSAHLPITWETRIVGRLGAYSKRAMRVLLRWYINPIIEQQNRYNSAVARTLVEMAAYHERMTREWQALEERVEETASYVMRNTSGGTADDGLQTADDNGAEHEAHEG